MNTINLNDLKYPEEELLKEQLHLYFQNKQRFLNEEDGGKVIYPLADEWIKKYCIQHKFGSTKMCFRLEQERFFKHLPDKKTYVFGRATLDKKKQGLAIKTSYVKYASTSKGIIYYVSFSSSDFKNNLAAIYSHFFDRFSQRCFDSELTRVEAIKSWITETRNGTAMRIKDDINIYFICEKGIVLGKMIYFDDNLNVYSLSEKSRKNQENSHLHSFTSFNTFISNDMLKGDQLEMRKEFDNEIKFNNFVKKVCKHLTLQKEFESYIFNGTKIKSKMLINWLDEILPIVKDKREILNNFPERIKNENS
jgi:hypothetical protein